MSKWGDFAKGFGAVAALGIGAKIVKDLLDPVLPDAPGLAQSMRFINELDSRIQPMAKELLNRAFSQNISLVVTSAYRDPTEQARLYAQGRTTPGNIVTNAPPGSSWHEFRRAFDVAVLANGRDTWPNDRNLWNQIGSIGKAVGLSWGGDFTTITDLPHFEYHPGETLAQGRAGLLT